jgi:exonuclease I
MSDTQEITDFCRKSVELLRSIEPKELEAMTPKQREKRLVGCSAVHRNRAFQEELDRMLLDQRQFLAEQAKTETEMAFGRAGINAILTIRERLNALHLQLEENNGLEAD